jgi:hypothetical protein
MTIKLGTKNEKRFGHKVTLFAAGTVQISKDGTFDVDNENIAKEVVETYPEDFFVVGDSKTETITLAASTTETTTMKPEELKKKAEEDELNQGEGNDLGGGDNEKNELIKSLDTMELDALKELANPFPKEEWETLGIKKLKAYLKGKLA